jgi:hypothetical protein
MYIDDLSLPQFPSDLSSRASTIGPAVLKRWLSKKPPVVFLAPNEREEVGDRVYFKFSFRRVMQLAIMAQLVANKIAPSDAAWMAAVFTDGENRMQPRAAGELFPRNYTLLYVVNGHAELVNVTRDLSWFSVHAFSSLAKPVTQIIINLNALDTHVRTVLGLPVQDREFD